MTDLGIASAAELHLSAALFGVRPDVLPYGSTGPMIVADDVITEPFAIEAGSIRVADGSGLGVELDEGKVAHYRVSR